MGAWRYHQQLIIFSSKETTGKEENIKITQKYISSLLSGKNYKDENFPVSSFLVPLFDSFSTSTVYVLERVFWWSHILGILFFLNYLYYSKHLHILLAFPNTYYSNLEEKESSVS